MGRLAIALLLGPLLLSCSSPPAETTTGGSVCVPGQSAQCACSNGETGAQVCNAEGTGFGACECTGSGGNGGTTSGTTSMGGSTGTVSMGGMGGTGGSTNSTSTSASTSTGTGGSAPTWSKIFCTPNASDELIGLTTDLDNNVVIAFRTGTIDLGGGPLQNVVVAKFDPMGNYQWGQGFPGNGTGLAVDAGGNVYLVGYFGSFADFGGGVLVSQGANDIFLVKLNSTGQHVYSKRLGGPSNDAPESIHIDLDGNLLIAGNIGSPVDFGGGLLPFQGAGDFFVLKLDAAANHVWSHSYGDVNGQFGIQIATDPQKNVLLGGKLQGTVDFGNGPLVASPGGIDAFVAKLSSGGTALWSKSFGDNPNQSVNSIAVDSASNLVVAGDFAGTINLGGTAFFAGNEPDGFAAKFDSNGVHLWSKHLTGAGAQGAYGVAVGPSNAVAVTGAFFATLDLGLGAMVSAGMSDIFAGRWDSTGSALWQQSYGDAVSQAGLRIAAPNDNSVVVAGATEAGALNFGDGPLECPFSQGDIVLAKLAP
ncbi:MAG: hypothetical protein IPK82_39915 [Polyangiaceae bacterium]|nr:hypothetical protein [Polyangiaceae bacterium]